MFYFDLFTLGILMTHVISAEENNIKINFQVQSEAFGQSNELTDFNEVFLCGFFLIAQDFQLPTFLQLW